jgi:hypothetical protein
MCDRSIDCDTVMLAQRNGSILYPVPSMQRRLLAGLLVDPYSIVRGSTKLKGDSCKEL